MAALPAGVQYGLSSESSYNENKDLVFVKLTDSALKAIEDFIRNSRGKLGASPTIQFLPGNEGKISIPGGNNGQQTATFHFSLSDDTDMEGPQGSFECVRSDGARRLETCGPLPRKMRVQAKEDVYEATRHRMAATDAEQKSKRTQEIKPNQTDIGRKVKVRHSLVGSSRAPRAPAARIAPAAPPAPAPVAPAPPAPAPAAHSPTPRAPPPRAPPPNANPDLMRRPIKERLIQLLALRPFKKPELYARINSEGIREKEKGVINNILQQISCLKDNCYQLHRHIWNDVNEDWPFYTEVEKQLLKRRKPQNLTPPLSSDSGQSLSPRLPGRQAHATRCRGAPAAKKQRISHYKKPSTPNATDLNSSRRGSPTASSGYHTSGGSSGASSGASSGERQASDEEPPAALTAPHHRAAQQEKDSRPVNLDNDVGMPDANLAVDDIDSIKIERDYPPISSGTTRRRYKADFGAQYAEYRTLYGRVDTVARLFTKLEHRLRRSQPGSQQYQDTKQEIVGEYERMQRDTGYQRDRARFTYLHRKLTHIKRMVADYDSRRAPQSPSQSMSARTGTEAY